MENQWPDEEDEWADLREPEGYFRETDEWADLREKDPKDKRVYEPEVIQKAHWPELEGKHWEEAKEVIMKENTDIREVIPLNLEKDTPSLSYKTSRIRLIVDDKGIIIMCPTLG